MAPLVSPCVFVISGPSGVGKGTICAYLRQVLADSVALSISATSRPPREIEVDGVHYHFKSREDFEAMARENAFVEFAEYNGHYYGTPKSSIRDQLEAGKSVLLEIDVQGAVQVKEAFPDACLIFIEPPSVDALAERLSKRGLNDAADIQRRVEIAQEELAKRELFDHIFINDSLDECQSAILKLIQNLALNKV